MSSHYTPGVDARVLVALRGSSGELLEPTAVQWRLIDEDGSLVKDWEAASFQPGAEYLELVVGAAYTTLAAGAVSGARVVEVRVETATGTTELTVGMVLRASSLLLPGVNTFVAYGRALLIADTLTQEARLGWERATREARERALVEAYGALQQLPLYQDGLAVWPLMKKGGIEALKPSLIDALRTAQVLEASAILDADPVLLARRRGLVSMTVGESSQYFGIAKPLELPVMSELALRTLRPWISWSVRIGRG